VAIKFNPFTSTFDFTGAASPPGTVASTEIFELSGTDITNKYVTLAGTPATASDTVLLVKDAPNMYYGDDFTVTGSQLGWNGLALEGAPEAATM